MEPLKIYCTKDYSIFKIVRKNRDIHPEIMVKSIREKNLLRENPIKCDKDLNVIDGQHRLKAAEILDLLIYYTISDQITVKDIPRFQIQKSWVLDDYLKHFGDLPDYIFIRRMVDEYKIPLYCAVACCSFGDVPYERFKDGIFSLKKDPLILERSIKMTMEVIEFLKKMVLITGKKDASFNNRLFRAIFHCCTIENYDHVHMLSALQSYSKYALELLNINSQSLIVESLRNGIYNRRMAEKNKI